MPADWIQGFGFNPENKPKAKDTKTACLSHSVDSEDRNSLGGKGAGLVEMTRAGFPVPPGFILTTDVCRHFYETGKLPKELETSVLETLASIETASKRKFGDPASPLLLSVRSGARISMPGMMDTVLNLGLNDETSEGLARVTGDAHFAFDSYRRFLQMYASVVLGLNLTPFEDILHQYRSVRRIKDDADLSTDDLRGIITRYKKKILRLSGSPFPQDVKTQLIHCILAVLKSWQSPRARAWRELYVIPETWGTAVIIQQMVFGNRSPQSGTGVAFTRNPSTGAPTLFGEFLLQAQGEDVVSGIRTPQPLTRAQKTQDRQVTLEDAMPDIFAHLVDLQKRLEMHYRDMQDIEFTIEEGKLWILQTRAGKRTTAAALRIALDLVKEGVITEDEALLRLHAQDLGHLLHPQLQSTQDLILLGKGLPASPGAAVGKIALTADSCVKIAAKGGRVILVREETSPEDIHGMVSAEGILTARGGMTSHAAVVARGMGKPGVVGTPRLHIDTHYKTVSLGGHTLECDDFLTLDGATGSIFKGEGALTPPSLSDDFKDLMAWADARRTIAVLANAETAEDIARAREFGSQGVGLCRTEHMFFEQDRIQAVRAMILADTDEERTQALTQVKPLQKADFETLLEASRGQMLSVRLLDPPLHEFLPQGESEIQQLAYALGKNAATLAKRVHNLREVNPMLGHRGCRLGITYPKIYTMQVEALFQAFLANTEKRLASGEPFSDGETLLSKRPSLSGPASLSKPAFAFMVPFISVSRELKVIVKNIHEAAMPYKERYLQMTGRDLAYQIGTMIELPRAALKAEKIAPLVDFISFGTNDLTQATFGFSRDDAAPVIKAYREKGLLDRDPFVSLDQSGVGELIEIACQRARKGNPAIRLGVCGEHAADPYSLKFFHGLGMH